MRMVMAVSLISCNLLPYFFNQINCFVTLLLYVKEECCSSQAQEELSKTAFCYCTFNIVLIFAVVLFLSIVFWASMRRVLWGVQFVVLVSLGWTEWCTPQGFVQSTLNFSLFFCCWCPFFEDSIFVMSRYDILEGGDEGVSAAYLWLSLFSWSDAIVDPDSKHLLFVLDLI